MTNESEYREQNTIRLGDTPEVIEEKINSYYFRYYKVTDAEYNVALELIKGMIDEAFKNRNVKMVLKYTKVLYKIYGLFHKRRKKGIVVDYSNQGSEKHSRK